MRLSSMSQPVRLALLMTYTTVPPLLLLEIFWNRFLEIVTLLASASPGN